MNDIKKCPSCGSTELILINEETKQYKCHACLKVFSMSEKPSSQVGDLNGIPNPKRKIFFDKLMEKTVELHAYFEKDVFAGTGFFISKDYLLTNAHVVLKGSGEHAMSEVAIQITGNNYGKTKQFIFDLVSADNKLDIAVLKLQEGTNEFVSFSQNIFNGEQVFAIGNSRGEGLCIVEGIVSDISRTIDSNQLFMTSAIVTNGNSGCPVFSSDGLLLGMITEGSKLSVAMNYAIPSSVLLDYIKKVEKNEEITIL